MQASGVRDGAGPQTRRVVKINVVASPRASLHGAPSSRGRGVDTATEAARAVAEPVRKQVDNPPTSHSTPSCQQRRAPPVPRFHASVDASKATNRATGGSLLEF